MCVRYTPLEVPQYNKSETFTYIPGENYRIITVNVIPNVTGGDIIKVFEK